MVILNTKYDIGLTPVTWTCLFLFGALPTGRYLLVTLSRISLVQGIEVGGVEYFDPSLATIMTASTGPSIYHGGPYRLLGLPGPRFIEHVQYARFCAQV